MRPEVFIDKSLRRLGVLPQKKIIIVETTSSCNVRCVWCNMQVHDKIKRGTMPLEKFKYIIEKNASYLKKNNYSVEPFFRGEPLLHKNLWEILDTLKEHGIRNQGINTNLSVDLEVERFADYDMRIIVNLGGTTKEVHEKVMARSDFDLVLSNLKRLWAVGIETEVKINPTKLNYHQLELLPEFLEKHGGKREVLKTYTTAFPIPSTASQKEIDTFFETVVCDEVDEYLRFTYDKSKKDKSIKTKKKQCNYLTDTVFYDGQFTICCHDQLQKINVGNLFESSLEEIRSSKKYKDSVKMAKRRQFEICHECN